VVDCDTDARTDDSNLLDQSWYNPLDISKGHRGFLDGDFVMFLYAWSPNWRLNAKGSDRYDLYVRRSFDGGVTWTTLPGSFTASTGDVYSGLGTTTCESYRATETGVSPLTEPKACFEYGVGANEQARNVTQHKSMRITTLDPRYASTPASIVDPDCLSSLYLPGDVEAPETWTCNDGSDSYDSDLRNPSRYFMVYETGDNTTVEVGEAEPMSLFYSRAVNFGDDYLVWAEETDLSLCYPSVDYSTGGLVAPAEYVGTGFCNEFDRMDAGGETEASEASLASNPDGSKLYGVWTQHSVKRLADGTITEERSDAMARRVWWIDGFIAENAWILGDGSN
jgi:hypothetical protein